MLKKYFLIQVKRDSWAIDSFNIYQFKKSSLKIPAQKKQLRNQK